MVFDEEKLNPIVRDIMHSVLRVKDDTPKEMIVAMVNYALAEMASSLRTRLELYDGTLKPLNNYTYVFAESGVGKDVTMTALNRIFIDSFKNSMERGFDKHKDMYWMERRMKLIDNGEDEEEVDDIIKEEMRMVSPFSYRISSGTLAGVSKSRVTYGLYNICAVNLVIDELGANYGMIRELIALMLSSYEDGSTEGRQLRNESVVAVSGVPSNFMGYSSPALAFDGGSTEKMLMADLSQGMARRSFCAYAVRPKPKKMTAEERVKQIRNNADDNTEKLKILNEMFAKLASPKNMNQRITISESADVLNMDYHMKCEDKAEKAHDLSEQERIELVNRAWKAKRLAGIYAFINNERVVNDDYMSQAIYVAELSGESFKLVMNQPQVFERMFLFMAGRKETTDVDLENQKWFSGSVKNKRELMILCRAYGYKNDHLFRVKEIEGVNFYSFLPMPKTDLDNVIISASKDLTKGYKKMKVSFEELHSLVTNPDFCYSASVFKGGHRKSTNYTGETNLVMIDIDGGMKLETAKLMLSDYKCMISTTRNHQKEKNGITTDRFRVIFITERLLKLNASDYSLFMANFHDFIGLPCDPAAKDCARAYYGATGDYWYSSGSKLISIDELIPDSEKEIKSREHKESIGFASMGGLEQFFIGQESNGRSNALIKYAFVLHGEGYDYDSATKKIESLNEKFSSPLSIKEIKGTIYKTLKGKYDD